MTSADGEGHSLALVTDDRVTGQTLAPPAVVTQWEEIEVELAEHGTPEVLDCIEVALLDAGAHQTGAWSKLGRPTAGRDAAAGEVVLAYLWEQADAIRATDPRLRQEVPDSVHARTETRSATLRRRMAVSKPRWSAATPTRASSRCRASCGAAPS